MIRLVLLSCCIGLTTGCTFVENRGRDFAQVVRARLAFGVGLYVEAEASSALRPAIGLADATLAPKLSIEHDPRASGRRGEVRTAAFPWLLIGWPLYGYGEGREGYGDTSPYLRAFVAPFVLAGQYHVEHHTVGLFYPEQWMPNPRLELDEGEALPPRADGVSDHGWFGVSATILVGRIDFGINLIELADAITGCVGLDLLSDDPVAHSEAP